MDYRLYFLGSLDALKMARVLFENCSSDNVALQRVATHLNAINTYGLNAEREVVILEKERRVFQGTMAQLLVLTESAS